MDKIVITGNGPLRGDVQVAGAKNAALPIIAASLLTAEPLELSNVPPVRDIGTALKLMEMLGAQVTREGTDLTLASSSIDSLHVPYELVKTMRGSILMLGPLVARFGEADVSLPGGCAIGTRPVNEPPRATRRLRPRPLASESAVSASTPTGSVTAPSG